MKKGITLFLLSLLFITPGCKQSKETIVNEYNIVPLPNQMIPQQGRFEISKKVRVITTACTPDVQIIADQPIEADIRNYHKANFRERNGRACYSFRAARRNARRGI